MTYKETILIVDDIPSNIDILANMLNTDYSISAATRGKDVFRVARLKRLDLILLDIMMPDMDGFEVCRKLKTDDRTKDIPVIFVTGKTDPADEAKGLALGAVDFITKPVNMPVVMARVKTHLALKQQKEDLEQRVRAQTFELTESLETLKIREEHLENITVFAMDAIIGLGYNGQVLTFNPSAERMFGLQYSEAIGQKLTHFIADSELQKKEWMTEKGFQNQMDLAVQTQKPIEFKGLRQDASMVDCEMTIASITVQEKPLYTCFVRDITQRNELLKSQKKALLAAESANKAKSEFLANMSHEIRSPMNAIMGMTELVLNTPLTEDQRANLEIVQESSCNLLGVINDILDLSKIEAKQLTLEQIPFDLRGQLESMCKSLAVQAHRKELELNLDIDLDVPNTLVGDPLRLKQILINLTNNALKFTEEGEVVIRVKQIQEKTNDLEFIKIHFSVLDTGIGIPADRIHAIFQPFTQADGSTTRKYGGTGLGLTICRNLVTMMGGNDVSVTSQENKGSDFSFTALFQVGQRTLFDPKTEDRQGGPTIDHLSNIRILLADKNKTGRTLIKTMLNRFGATIEEAMDETSLMKQWRQTTDTKQAFDIILLDHGMMIPEETNIGKMDTPNKKEQLIHLLPTHLQSQELLDEKNCPKNLFLKKPVQLYPLIKVIDQALGRTIQVKPQKNTQTRQPIQPLNILLVDDIEHNQKLATSILERDNHRITLANDGYECLDQLQNNPFDLILMDINMPGMNGFETTQRIRDFKDLKYCDPNIPIIAVTARAMKEEEMQCITSGMNGYLRKPYQASELTEIIKPFTKKRLVSHSPATPSKRPPPLKPVEHTEHFHKMRQSLLEEGENHMEVLKKALDTRKIQPILKTVHWIRTTSADVGANRLKVRAIRLKGSAEMNEWENTQEIYISLEQEFQHVLQALSEIRKS